jgi:DNA gyrase subunit A
MSDKFKKQDAVDTLIQNYLPYCASVIISRALPEIDGFKPSHRKLLWSMYTMGLLTGGRTKSANIVGNTMKFNPHGDQAIYETMVRLTQKDTLLFPYVEGKGNFGQHTSKLLQEASSRYTEAKMSGVCGELFNGIRKDAVEMIPNYDGTLEEPKLLPTTFPNILVNANMGIAVGMASNICSFNLDEVCRTTIEYIKNKEHDITETLLAPDFATGGTLLYGESDIKKIYETGRGSIKVRAKYRYNKQDNSIEVYEIPYTTSREDIIDKIIALIKANDSRVTKEIADVRDLTDKGGLMIGIELKRGANPDKLMQYLYAKTPLQDSFGCNFNILIDNRPRVMGVKSILDAWIAFRVNCIKRQTQYDINEKARVLHLAEGLEKVLLDLDVAVNICRSAKSDKEAIQGLIEKFKVDDIQAEAIANIRIRDFNKEYILKKTRDISQYKAEIRVLTNLMSDGDKINSIIINQLEAVIKKYLSPRRTEIEYDEITTDIEEEIENYNLTIFTTKEGYLKKIPLTSMRNAGEHKLKENDEIKRTIQAQNTDDILIFTKNGNVHRLKAHKVADKKVSDLGLYLPSELGLDADDSVVDIIVTSYEKGENALIVYESGYMARVNMNAYKSNYAVLKGNIKEKAIAVEKLTEDIEIMFVSSEGKMLIIGTDGVNTVESRTAKGVKVMKLSDSILVGVKVNPQPNTDITLITEKKGEVVVHVKGLEYYRGSRGNVGTFIYNCRQQKDVVKKIINV